MPNVLPAAMPLARPAEACWCRPLSQTLHGAQGKFLGRCYDQHSQGTAHHTLGQRGLCLLGHIFDPSVGIRLLWRWQPILAQLVYFYSNEETSAICLPGNHECTSQGAGFAVRPAPLLTKDAV